jgi:hypothetical protein
MKLLDIDALELARQLTIQESNLYNRIRVMECLSRAKEQKSKSSTPDNISLIIERTNQVGCRTCVKRLSLTLKTGRSLAQLSDSGTRRLEKTVRNNQIFHQCGRCKLLSKVCILDIHVRLAMSYDA